MMRRILTALTSPLSWPITVKIPMLVALLMVIVSVVITNRVLSRLADSQERHLGQLASAYLDGLSASLIPSVVREDIWEVFDTLDRSRERYRGLNVDWTVVTNGSNRVLAASNPGRFPSGKTLAEEMLSQFPGAGVEWAEQVTTAYLARPLTYQDREIGHIYAVADIRPLLQERSEVFATLALTNAVLTLVLAAIGYYAVRRMVQPVRILSVQLDRSTQGPIEPIPETTVGAQGGEFRRLFRRYNALARAVNEREELAAKLAEEEKLASLGRLASGLAHEINNPLGGMFNALDSLRRHGERETVRATSTRLLEQGLAGIRDLVRSTLAVYRDDGTPRRFSPGDIDDLRLLIEPEIKRKRLVEAREFHRLGGEQLVQFHGRIVCATNADVTQAIEQGRFRQDLYYRINGFHIDVPPLRSRSEDIPWLLDLFFERFKGEGQLNLRGISTLVYEIAHEHPWPGNVRELRNRMERAVAMAMGDWIMPADMFPDLESGLHPMLAAFSTLAEVRESAERRQIERALKQTDGQIIEAAKLLDISRTTLWEKMRRLYISGYSEP